MSQLLKEEAHRLVPAQHSGPALPPHDDDDGASDSQHHGGEAGAVGVTGAVGGFLLDRKMDHEAELEYEGEDAVLQLLASFC